MAEAVLEVVFQIVFETLFMLGGEVVTAVRRRWRGVAGLKALARRLRPGSAVTLALFALRPTHRRET